MHNRSPLRITSAMLAAGESAFKASREAGHTPRATVHVVFTAMLAESAWSPALRKRPSAAYATERLTRADFNDDGLRYSTNPDGTTRIQHIYNYNHLRPTWKAELAERDRQKRNITLS
jgi:hypothetical protein